MKDEVRKAVETIRQYLYELEEEKTLDVQNILNVSDFERAVAEVLDGIGITPRTIHLHLTDPLIWSTIRDKTGLSIDHQLASIFDLTTYELEGMKLEGFEENEYTSGMVTSENLFLYNREQIGRASCRERV